METQYRFKVQLQNLLLGAVMVKSSDLDHIERHFLKILFGPHSVPLGGSNAPFRCLPTDNKKQAEEEEDEAEVYDILLEYRSKKSYK